MKKVVSISYTSIITLFKKIRDAIKYNAIKQLSGVLCKSGKPVCLVSTK